MNFYLNVAQLEHNVVVDFIQLKESDFGDYVITVTSCKPKNSTLEIAFTVERNESPEATSIYSTGEVQIKFIEGFKYLSY